MVRHSMVLAIAYATVCAAWWGLRRMVPLWREVPRPAFAHPWRELGVALLGVVGVLFLGQLWTHGLRLEASGGWAPLVESINQILIFSPLIAVPILRRQGWASLWIRTDALPARLATGIALALVALLVYSAIEPGAPSWPETVRQLFRPSRAHLAVQVLLEDVGIAILLVRLSAAAGRWTAIVGVALLFAAGHVPAMLARGDPALEFFGLVRDFGLGVLVCWTAWRGADVAWLWPVHYALDITQFLRGGPSLS